jgi:serine/threonine protein kinase
MLLVSFIFALAASALAKPVFPVCNEEEYEPVKSLGSGASSGDVLLLKRKADQKHFAQKQCLGRCEKEITILTHLTIPTQSGFTPYAHTPKLVCASQNMNSFIMEYVPGKTLLSIYNEDDSHEFVEEAGIPFKKIAKVMVEAMADLHDRGVRNSDANLANWILDPSSVNNFRLSLIDFGNAEMVNPSATLSAVSGNGPQDSESKQDVMLMGETLYSLYAKYKVNGSRGNTPPPCLMSVIEKTWAEDEAAIPSFRDLLQEDYFSS